MFEKMERLLFLCSWGQSGLSSIVLTVTISAWSAFTASQEPGEAEKFKVESMTYFYNERKENHYHFTESEFHFGN